MEILPAYHYQFSGLLTAAASLFLVILVYRKGMDQYLKTRFALYYLSLFVWSFSLFICTSVYDYKVAYFFTQMTHAGAILIPVFFLHFTFAYLNSMSRIQKSLLWILYGIAAFFMIINLFFRDLFFGNVVPKLSFPYFPNAGRFYTPWVVTFGMTVLIAHLVLLKAMMAASGLRKKQIRFFFLANALGYFGGIGCFLPVYNLPYFPFPYGPYGVLLLSFVSGYAILRYRFIDLQILLKKTIVFAVLFAFIIGTFSFILFIFQNILSSYININPFLISAICAAVIISVYDTLREFLINITDKYLFQKKENIKVVLNTLSRNIITILEIDKVGQIVLSTLEKTLRLEAGAIVIKSEHDESYRLLESFGIENKDLKFQKNDLLIRYFAETQELIVNLEDPSRQKSHPREVQEKLRRLKAVIGIPLFMQEDLMGILFLGKKKSDQEFNQEEIDYFPTVAGQVAIALSNARQIEIQRRNLFEYAQQSKLATIGTLVAGIGHEAKNPLQIIGGGLDFMRFSLRQGFFNNLNVEQLTTLNESIDRMKGGYERVVRIIGNISDFSKKRKEAVRESVNIEKAADLALELAQYDFKLGSVEIVKQYHGQLPSITADMNRLAEVFLNILKNARDAIVEAHQKDPSRDKVITIRSEARESEVELMISDTGTGISKENLDRIFDPFFTTKDVSGGKNPEKIKGTGLGLHIAKQVVEELGGRIAVESSEGKGTNFYFIFPIRNEK